MSNWQDGKIRGFLIIWFILATTTTILHFIGCAFTANGFGWFLALASVFYIIYTLCGFGSRWLVAIPCLLTSVLYFYSFFDMPYFILKPTNVDQASFSAFFRFLEVIAYFFASYYLYTFFYFAISKRVRARFLPIKPNSTAQTAKKTSEKNIDDTDTNNRIISGKYKGGFLGLDSTNNPPFVIYDGRRIVLNEEMIDKYSVLKETENENNIVEVTFKDGTSSILECSSDITSVFKRLF